MLRADCRKISQYLAKKLDGLETTTAFISAPNEPNTYNMLRIEWNRDLDQPNV
jgi:hypothetical protein